MYRPCRVHTLNISSNQITNFGMSRLLLALRAVKGQENHLGKLIARENRLQVSSRLLALIGDLVVYHNRTLRVIDILPKKTPDDYESTSAAKSAEKNSSTDEVKKAAVST